MISKDIAETKETESNTGTASRRQLLARTVFGAGAVGLRALASGLPVAVLAKPLEARAQAFTCGDKTRAQYLIIAAGSSGDPMNCNVPGTYDFPDIAHSPDPRMAATPLSLGIPGSAYSRADENPVTPHDSNLFFSSATEKLCMAVAAKEPPAEALRSTFTAACSSPFAVALGL